jgi:hypothetical protein
MNARGGEGAMLDGIEATKDGLVATLELCLTKEKVMVWFDTLLRPWKTSLAGEERPILPGDIYSQEAVTNGGKAWKRGGPVQLSAWGGRTAGWRYELQSESTVRMGSLSLAGPIQAVITADGQAWIGPKEATVVATRIGLVGIIIDDNLRLNAIVSKATFATSPEGVLAMDKWATTVTAGRTVEGLEVQTILEVKEIEGFLAADAKVRSRDRKYKVSPLYEDGQLFVIFPGQEEGAICRVALDEGLRAIEAQCVARPRGITAEEDPSFLGR